MSITKISRITRVYPTQSHPTHAERSLLKSKSGILRDRLAKSGKLHPKIILDRYAGLSLNPDSQLCLKKGLSRLSSPIACKINNNAPILQLPKGKSLHFTSEELKNMKVEKYGNLTPIINHLPKKKRLRAVWNINRGIRDSLAKEGRLNEEFGQYICTHEYGGKIGSGVKAIRDIQQFQPIGPYAGLLYTTETEVDKAIAKYGRESICGYLMDNPNGEGAIDPVSGIPNSLALINSAKLGGSEINGGRNNVAIVYFGPYPFFVATEYIPKGTQLCVDYGNQYISQT